MNCNTTHYRANSSSVPGDPTSSSAPLHFLQIWIQPAERNIEPSYEEKRFAPEEKRGRLRLIVSPDRADGSLLIHQDARVYAGLLTAGEGLDFEAPGRRIYLHVARGALTANGTLLETGDALRITDGSALHLSDAHDAEVLVFDLPGQAG